MVNLAPKTFRFLRYSTLSTSGFTTLSTTRLFSSVYFRPPDVIAWTRLHSTSASFTEHEYDDEIPDDVKTTEKQAALRMALSKLAGDFGEESMLSSEHFFGSRRTPVISTGSLRLDQALGIGGLPKGRMVEIYGQEASGKTTLALHIIQEAQRLGGYCAYLDVENAMNPLFAESIGVNTDKLLISQPDSAENLLSVVDTLTKSGSIDVIVVDSVAALVPQSEVDALSCSSSRDLQSKIMTQALRKIHYSLCRSNTLIIFINQVRRNLRLEHGSIHAEEVTCGGNALKFYAAVRLRISRKGLLRSDDKVNGLGICVQVVKNKLAPSMTKAWLRIQFGRGFCRELEALELACEHSILWKEGSNIFIDRKVFNNKEDAVSYLAANKEATDEIVRILRHQLFEREK